MSPLQRKTTPPHLALKGLRQERFDAVLDPAKVQVMTQLMTTLSSLNLPAAVAGIPAEVIEVKKDRVLVAKYGLPSSMAGARRFLDGSADKMMAELVAHETEGREVVQLWDEKRKLWVYEVYERVPREAAGGGS